MPEFDTSVPALLIRLDPNPFHHGTLGAVRSLGRAGIEVHAVLAAAGPVVRSRYLTRLHQPPPSHADTDLHDTLCRVSDVLGRPAVLLALDDRGALALAALRPLLGDRYLLPDTTPDLPARVADKAELASVCEALGIPHPATLLPRTPREAVGAARELGLPAVAKWSRPWLLPPGLRSTTLVRDPRDAAALWEHSTRAGSRLLLQRHLPGGRGTDWFFHGYAADHGALLTGGAGRKELSWPPRTGLTAVGTWRPNPDVEHAAARLAARVGYRGILDLDFRRDTTTGDYHLLDFNPRPGAQFRLFTDDAGVDVVRAQHLHLTGRPVPPVSGGAGRTFVAENYAALSALASVASATARRRTPRRVAPPPATPTPPATGRTWRCRTVEAAWFAADDTAPFRAMARAWLAGGAVRLLRRARRAAPEGAAGTPAVLRPVTGPPVRFPGGGRAAEAPWPHPDHAALAGRVDGATAPVPPR